MEKEPIENTPRKNVTKEVLKDLLGAKEKKERRGVSGRESPESGSLYSDYESGQQYEQDLPSGYNSGEQYDTLSTGYMSGEAYELPETRPEPLEPTLAAIEEVSMRSAEDLFTIQMPENNLLAQVDRIQSSSSGSIQDTLESAQPEVNPHKGKRKKNVTYCVSVPMEKSPLGQDIRGYRDLPSDTDTTSCFDSDGTYMRSDGLQSSDSGAALIHHSTRRKRKDLRDGSQGIIRGHGQRVRRKAKGIIRNHEEFFLIYDNKHWEIARQICFWFSVLAILGSILTAAVMIGVMPRSCDPEVSWWQGSVILEIRPVTNPGVEAILDLRKLIDSVPLLSRLGFKGVKLVDLYLKDAASDLNGLGSVTNASNDLTANYYDANDFDMLRRRLTPTPSLVSELAGALHAANLSLLVDLPTYSANRTVEPELDFKITKAIQFWAGHGVNGISLVGLETYAAGDRFVSERVAAWSTDFEKYSHDDVSQRILVASYHFPEAVHAASSAQAASGTKEGEDTGISSEAKEALAGFGLLEAVLDQGNLSQLETKILAANKWDKSSSKPWILWRLPQDEIPSSAPDSFSSCSAISSSPANLAFHMFLPGTIALPGSVMDAFIPGGEVEGAAGGSQSLPEFAAESLLPEGLAAKSASESSLPEASTAAVESSHPETTTLPEEQELEQDFENSANLSLAILGQLIEARRDSVPLYMNGNYKVCHGSCDGEEREDNFKITTFVETGLVVMERHYNRRNRMMLIANFGCEAATDLKSVGKMFSSGEVVVDTTGAHSVGSQVEFNSFRGIPAQHALVIKLPK